MVWIVNNIPSLPLLFIMTKAWQSITKPRGKWNEKNIFSSKTLQLSNCLVQDNVLPDLMFAMVKTNPMRRTASAPVLVSDPSLRPLPLHRNLVDSLFWEKTATVKYFGRNRRRTVLCQSDEHKHCNPKFVRRAVWPDGNIIFSIFAYLQQWTFAQERKN